MKITYKEHRIPVVYKITNLTNGKIYVGSTKNLYRRYVSYRKYEKEHIIDGISIEYAIKKYRFESFDFSILETVEISKLTEREQYWIDILQPFDGNGYNECRIASRTSGTKRRPETIERMRAAQSRPDLSEFRRQLMNKAVLQIDMNTLEIIKEYESAKIAGEILGVRACGISSVCSKSKKSMYGFYWCFKKEYQEIGFIKPANNSKTRKVIQSDMNGNFIKEWNSSKEIERHFGFNNTLIRACCRNEYKQAYGFQWKEIPTQ